GPPPAPKRRSPWPRVLLGVVILACGTAIGVGAGVISTRKATKKRILDSWNNPRRAHESMAKRMQRELDLSPEQAKQVQDIVSLRMGEVRKIMEERRPLIDEQFDLMKDEVAEVLDERQAQEWRERLQRVRRGPGPPRGGRHRNGRGDWHKRDRDESDGPDRPRRGDGSDPERGRSHPPGPKPPAESQGAGST
ncbi:MAG: hypothetical protein PVH68_09140, partial [Armatimonadota bacterium]